MPMVLSSPKPGILIVPLSNRSPVQIRESGWPVLAGVEVTDDSLEYQVFVRGSSQESLYLVYAVQTNSTPPGGVLSGRLSTDYYRAINGVCADVGLDEKEVFSRLPAEDLTGEGLSEVDDPVWEWHVPGQKTKIRIEVAQVPEGLEGYLERAFPGLQLSLKPNKGALERVLEDPLGTP